MEVVRLFVVFLVVKVAVSLRGKRANLCSLYANILNIENGSHRMKAGGSSIEFWCNDGFVLYGVDRLFCFGVRWHTKPPKCITNTCQTLPVTEPLRAEKKYDGALLKFSCAVMNRLRGPEIIICNGTRWSDTTPTCEYFVPTKSCTFEDQEQCGWEHHDHTDVKWRLNSGKTSTSRTGPQHDHTLGASGNGHYMYFETSNNFAKAGHKAILMSPLYPRNFSGDCFSFWYHILADGDVSLLEVFVKPENKSRKDLKSVFSVHENKGDKWVPHVVTIPQMPEPFQILFVATKSNSIRSDIAIDDLSLATCPVEQRTTETAEKPFFTTLVTVARSPSRPTTTPETFSVTVVRQTQVHTTTRITTAPSQSQNKTKPKTVSVAVPNQTDNDHYLENFTTTSHGHSSVSQDYKKVAWDNSVDITYIIIGVGVGFIILVLLTFAIYYAKRKKKDRFDETVETVNPLYIADSDEASLKMLDKSEW